MHKKRQAYHRSPKRTTVLSLAAALLVLCLLLPEYAFALTSDETAQANGEIHLEDIPLTESTDEGVSTPAAAAVPAQVTAVVPLCVCKKQCTDDYTNAACPACAVDRSGCEGVPQAEAVVPLCTCAEKCTEDHTNTACPACAVDRNDCDGVPQAEAVVPLCTCAEKCTEHYTNTDCPVCAVDRSGCEGVPQIEGTLPIYELEHKELQKSAADGALISASGLMPAEAVLEVEVVPIEVAAELLEDGAEVLFAYDIRIMLPGDPKPVEYQPTALSPVTVSIAPPQPIEAPTVEVVHITEDEETGETTLQPVADVTTTENGVEFEAEGFSVYVIRVNNTALAVHTVIFPVGDYRVEYSTTATGHYTVLTSLTVTLGGASESTSKYDTLYFKVTPNAGFTLGTVTSSRGNLTQNGEVYALDVSGAEATTTVNITVTGVKITGIPAQGKTLTAVVSSGSSGTFSYTWQSCDTATGAFSAITGQTGAAFTLPNDTTYNGKYIQVEATDGTVSYTSALVGPVAADGTITFDIGSGNVKIGESGMYRGYNSEGALITGTHNEANIYMVTGTAGSDAEGGNKNVTLSGEGNFNVTLSGASIYTGKTGGAYEGKGICAPVSTSGVVGTGNINITLDGINTLENVSSNPSDSYAALEKAYSGSTLIIDGDGTLYAMGGADSAGIGSSDKIGGGTKNITIKSGTITASARASEGAGIGSGNNSPAENIRIYGGNITAIGISNGAGIGGSGSVNHIAASGQVYIYGGTITATSTGTGAGIGGGGSGASSSPDSTATGGGGEVHIEGGIINASSIGGGDGGLCGGMADIDISGGTITAANISGGHGAGGSHAGGNLTVTGGSAKVAHVCPAITTNGVDGTKPLTYNVYVANGGVAVPNAKVTDIDVTPSITYGLNDVYTDAQGRLYLWLPSGKQITSVEVMINGVETPCSTTTNQAAAYITPAADQYGFVNLGETLTANLTYGAETEWRWEKFDSGAWTPISGASAKNYEPTADDIGKELRVVINNTYTSPSVFINIPQMSVTVPSGTVVTVNGAGQCTVEGGSITNNSAVDVYVTNVAYSWVTSGSGDADELFGDYTQITAGLTLSGASYSFSGAAPTQATPTAAAGKILAKVGDTPGTLPLNWTFTLGTGNYLHLAPAMGAGVHVATVTYTVQPVPRT